MRSRVKRIGATIAVAIVLLGIVQPAWLMDFRPQLHDSAMAYFADSSGRTFSVVTFNLWRLCDSSRVPKIHDALIEIQRDFVGNDVSNQLPDILFFQELECDGTTVKLHAALQATHTFDYAICGKFRNGEPRSGVAISVSQSKFELVSVTEMDLGQLWGDHRRCALHAVLRDRVDGAEIDVINVHHSPHPFKVPQTEKLIAEFERLGLNKRRFVLIGGDFNFAPSSSSYDLVSQWFNDSIPANRGKTHWLGGQIDLLFVNDGIRLIKPLNRTLAHQVIQPTKLFRPYYRCSSLAWDGCALSDHMPEGGLFLLQQ